jgi:hypothetical protein
MMEKPRLNGIGSIGGTLLTEINEFEAFSQD